MELSDIQKQILSFCKDRGLNSNVSVRVIDLMSEVGELSKEVLKGTDYGSKQFEQTENWQSELGDVLFSLICIANDTNFNLEECLRHVLEKYEKRFADKGDMGSGR